jgi:hypothetical protein
MPGVYCGTLAVTRMKGLPCDTSTHFGVDETATTEPTSSASEQAGSEYNVTREEQLLPIGASHVQAAQPRVSS